MIFSVTAPVPASDLHTGAPITSREVPEPELPEVINSDVVVEVVPIMELVSLKGQEVTRVASLCPLKIQQEAGIYTAGQASSPIQ